MKISVSVMAHPDRKEMAEALFAKLKMMPFSSSHLVFDRKDYEWETGCRALRPTELKSDWHIVIQDDAIISDNFYQNCEKALEKVPKKTCISFYWGTGSPYPDKTGKQLKFAEEKNISWIRTPTLFWGVCFAVPTDEAEHIVNFGAGMDRPFDNRVGLYFWKQERGVYNLVPSIVDHNDDTPSLLEHGIQEDGSKRARKAHHFESGLIEPNKNVLIF